MNSTNGRHDFEGSSFQFPDRIRTGSTYDYGLFGITGRRHRRIGCSCGRRLFIVIGTRATQSHDYKLNRPRYATQCNAERLGMNAQWITATFVSNQTCNIRSFDKFSINSLYLRINPYRSADQSRSQKHLFPPCANRKRPEAVRANNTQRQLA